MKDTSVRNNARCRRRDSSTSATMFSMYQRCTLTLRMSSKLSRKRWLSTSDDLLVNMARGASITDCKSNTEMVDKIVRAGLLSNRRAIDAMLAVDRRYFFLGIKEEVPSQGESGSACYDNVPINIGKDATISTPQFCAEVLQLLAPKLNPGAKVLDIGCGSAYMSSLFAVMVKKEGCVVGIDCFDELVENAKINVFNMVQQGVASGNEMVKDIGTIELHCELFPGSKHEFFRSKVIIDNHHKDSLYDCIYVAPCIEDSNTLSKLNKLLKPNGRLVVPYFNVEKSERGQQLLCLDKGIDVSSDNEDQLWETQDEIMPVLCQILQTKHSVEKINEEQKKMEEDKNVRKISKKDAKKEMLEWVATFEAKNARKPTREDIENDSEGNRLFEVFRNAPGKA